MRVLFVNLNRSPVFGGVERWMMDAAAGLAGRGHRCAMLARPGAPWAAAARSRGLVVHEEHRGAWIARAWRVRGVMRRERPDVVVVKAKKAARMAAFGRAAGGGGRVALFFGLTHELDRRRWVDRFTWRHVDAGIVVARSAADWYAAAGFGPREKLHVLWKGVELADYDTALVARDATRAALGISDGELLVGTVCRLAWQKGIDQLLAAIRIVAPRLPNARWLVVGNGRERPQIEAAAHALGAHVTFLGQRDDVPALLAAMDCFVQPSRQEAMVQTTLEAMAAGRAVVSTRTVGADEAIAHEVSGWLVPVDDPPAMAEAVVVLGRDAARRARLGRAARARIEDAFTMAHMVARCEDVLARIARGEAARG